MRHLKSFAEDTFTLLSSVLVLAVAAILAAAGIVLIAAAIAAPFAGIAFGVLFPLHWFGVIG